MKSKRASVLWTGGKDSALALYDARRLGYDVVSLLTFAPEGERFRAHPLDLMHFQAQALGIAHSVVPIREPFKESYEKAITDLKKSQGIDALVTGDIAEIDGRPNWIAECSQPSQMEVCVPLWHADRKALMNRIVSLGFKAIFSCVRRPWFTEDWVGRPLDDSCLRFLDAMAADTSFDVCGENGEYHTIVLDGPFFEKEILIESFSVHQEDSLLYLSPHSASLRNK